MRHPHRCGEQHQTLHAGRRRGLRPRWWWQRAVLLAIVADLALLTAACGSSGPSPSRGAYSACMRKHGVTGFFAAPLPTSMPTSLGSHNSVQVPAKAAAAMQACHSLAPHAGQLSGPG